MNNIKKMLFPLRALLLLLFLVLFLSGYRGCSQIPSSKEFAESFVGDDIASLINLWQHPNSYQLKVGWKKEDHMSVLPNGNIKYTDDTEKGCTTIWEVNSSGMIVGYELLGKYCD